MISKTVNGFAIFIGLLFLFAQTGFSQPIDKKCKEIYANYLEKDSLLKVTHFVNDSLVKVNNDLHMAMNKLQGQLDAIERDAKLIKIGNQKWDNDNLKVTSLNDGTPIFFADTRSKWDSLFRIGEPAYCFHKIDSTGNYGYLYNYYAVESGKLASIGMRIPTKADIKEFIDYLDLENAKSAMLLKSNDTTSVILTNWKTKGTDKYGMNIKPFGFRLDDSKEWYFGNKVYYWCQSNEPKKIDMMVITEINDDPFLFDKTVEEKNSNYGLFVRCIK
ncbi:MAG: fibrobacter succinogenes major paralogous domain-containing protein [Crocinitomicaceae bacterium]|nr:fibrobacter succinogenes major paralogous domain-containing protein [Crocinitomicaceae bacterium]MCF8433530.1 fibrobacter succinogenes major paralogous domain-containing protein [Crocinitomicaceae bacterium]